MGPGSVTVARVASLEQEVAELRRRLDERDDLLVRLEARLSSPPPSPGGHSADEKSFEQDSLPDGVSVPSVPRTWSHPQLLDPPGGRGAEAGASTDGSWRGGSRAYAARHQRAPGSQSGAARHKWDNRPPSWRSAPGMRAEAASARLSLPHGPTFAARPQQATPSARLKRVEETQARLLGSLAEARRVAASAEVRADEVASRMRAHVREVLAAEMKRVRDDWTAERAEVARVAAAESEARAREADGRLDSINQALAVAKAERMQEFGRARREEAATLRAVMARSKALVPASEGGATSPQPRSPGKGGVATTLLARDATLEAVAESGGWVPARSTQEAVARARALLELAREEAEGHRAHSLRRAYALLQTVGLPLSANPARSPHGTNGGPQSPDAGRNGAKAAGEGSAASAASPLSARGGRDAESAQPGAAAALAPSPTARLRAKAASFEAFLMHELAPPASHALPGQSGGRSTQRTGSDSGPTAADEGHRHSPQGGTSPSRRKRPLSAGTPSRGQSAGRHAPLAPQSRAPPARRRAKSCGRARPPVAGGSPRDNGAKCRARPGSETESPPGGGVRGGRDATRGGFLAKASPALHYKAGVHALLSDLGRLLDAEVTMRERTTTWVEQWLAYERRATSEELAHAVAEMRAEAGSLRALTLTALRALAGAMDGESAARVKLAGWASGAVERLHKVVEREREARRADMASIREKQLSAEQRVTSMVEEQMTRMTRLAR